MPDREKVIINWSNCLNNHDEMTVEQALDFATDEGCPPTIDAIPVEWLEWRIEHAEREGFVEIAKMLQTVRDWWNDQRDIWRDEKEQEAQDG